MCGLRPLVQVSCSGVSAMPPTNRTSARHHGGCHLGGVVHLQRHTIAARPGVASRFVSTISFAGCDWSALPMQCMPCEHEPILGQTEPIQWLPRACVTLSKAIITHCCGNSHLQMDVHTVVLQLQRASEEMQADPGAGCLQLLVSLQRRRRPTPTSSSLRSSRRPLQRRSAAKTCREPSLWALSPAW
jgi:hypothetical protein